MALNLITDRTQADVLRVETLSAKGFANMTHEEKVEWLSTSMKGAYNYTDLNRVNAAMDYLAAQIRDRGYRVALNKMEIPHKGASLLPEGYTQLECIESSGTQYIDTGFKPKYNTRVVVNVSDVATESYLFGARDADSTTAAKQYGLYYNASKNMRSDYFGTNASLAVADASVRATIDKNANIVSLYGSKITNTAVTSGETAYPLWLFAVNNIGSAKANATMKLYSCKIYDNGTLIRDYIPCINPNGVAGLYDMAEGKFYGNAGTGEFATGGVVESPEEGTDNSRDPYLWYEDDIPTPGMMQNYLENVSVIRNALQMPSYAPAVPNDMDGLTVDEANSIETILSIVEILLINMSAAWLYSGEIFSGEV